MPHTSRRPHSRGPLPAVWPCAAQPHPLGRLVCFCQGRLRQGPPCHAAPRRPTPACSDRGRALRAAVPAACERHVRLAARGVHLRPASPLFRSLLALRGERGVQLPDQRHLRGAGQRGGLPGGALGAVGCVRPQGEGEPGGAGAGERCILLAASARSSRAGPDVNLLWQHRTGLGMPPIFLRCNWPPSARQLITCCSTASRLRSPPCLPLRWSTTRCTM